MKNEQTIKIMLREVLSKIEVVTEMTPMTNDVLYKSLMNIVTSIDNYDKELERLKKANND
jgi:GTP1/Obg family GTP-binding protein